MAMTTLSPTHLTDDADHVLLELRYDIRDSIVPYAYDVRCAYSLSAACFGDAVQPGL